MKITAIALNTLRENIRDKVFYNLLLFALLLIAGTILLSELAIGQEVKILVDVGLSAVTLFGAVIAVLLGVSLVSKELDKRTIYCLLSKPVPRYEFILGKYLGMGLTLLIDVAFMAIGIYLALFYLEGEIAYRHLRLISAIGLILLQLMLLTSIALFFSTFSTPVLSALFSFSLWIAGHMSGELKRFASIIESPIIAYFCSVVYYLLPNFSNFATVRGEDLIRSAAHMAPVDPAVVWLAMAYAVLYSSLVVAAAALVFERRDLK